MVHTACTFDERPGGTLEVARDELETVLRVRGNGLGISPEVLPRIFDLFTQADRTIERSGGGLGIGLTVVRSLVIMHGGTIAATSDGLGKGSEFAVRLPAMIEPPKLELTASKPRPIGRRRVLVVDDNVGAATILAKLLTKLWSHEVVVAHDGVSALELAQKHRPQIVLLDIGLPGIDGYEVAKRLRGPLQFNETLIAAVTGYGLDSDRLRSAEAGIDEYLVKPISVSVLEQLFAHPKLAGQLSESPSENVHAGPENHSSDE